MYGEQFYAKPKPENLRIFNGVETVSLCVILCFLFLSNFKAHFIFILQIIDTQL